MPPWVVAILVPVFEFLGKEVPVWIAGAPAAPPPDGKKPAFNDVDAKVDAERAKQRDHVHDHGAPTSPNEREASKP